MTQERIWIGDDFPKTLILVLGESWYGTYEGDLVTDAGWIKAYLDGKVTDRMYSKIANSCTKLHSRKEYWHSVAYTNFVQRVGGNPSDRPTKQQYLDAKPRLDRLLDELMPRGVWILGIGQSGYSKPVVEAKGIICEVVVHPTGVGVTNIKLGESWARLQLKLENQQEHRTAPNPPRLQLAKAISTAGRTARIMPKTRSSMKLVVSALPEPLVVKKYKFPKRASVYELIINGKKCHAAKTQGGTPLRSYTYFIWDGVSYYVSGHISPLVPAILIE